MLTNFISVLGDRNPQLARELKGKLTVRNLAATALISFVFQGFLFLYFLIQLPDNNIKFTPTSRYCKGLFLKYSYGFECERNALGNWDVNRQLFCLDMFVALSVSLIITLLMVGSYLLITDLAKEERNGTLNFIRQSPEKSENILLGKILGVPVLLYFGIASVLPYHFLVALEGKIDLGLLMGFYVVVLACYGFFASLALLYGLVSQGLGIFQTILPAGALFFYLISMTKNTLTGYYLPFNDLEDWLRLFYPGTILPYLLNSTGYSDRLISFGQIQTISQIKWFDLNLWENAYVGIALIVGNLALWNFWVWVSLGRKFNNPNATLLNKASSYWFSTTTVGILSGFAVQYTNPGQLYNNFTQLLFFILVMFLVLIGLLSPRRQTLIDWVNYRHLQNNSLWKDLIWGEKSPSVVAIAINLICCAIIILPVVLLLPLQEYQKPLLIAVFFHSSIILIYGIIYQLGLLQRKRKGVETGAIAVVITMVTPMILSFLLGKVYDVPPQFQTLWLFSALASISIPQVAASSIFWAMVTQVLGICLGTMIMTRKLKELNNKARLLKS